MRIHTHNYFFFFNILKQFMRRTRACVNIGALAHNLYPIVVYDLYCFFFPNQPTDQPAGGPTETRGKKTNLKNSTWPRYIPEYDSTQARALGSTIGKSAYCVGGRRRKNGDAERRSLKTRFRRIS